MTVFLLILFLNATGGIERHYIGGAGDTVQACQQFAALMIEEIRANDPAAKDLTPYPLCLDVAGMKQLEKEVL